MKGHHIFVGAILGIWVAVLTAVAGSAAPDGQAARVTSEKLGGRTRYLAHVSTDKPIYRGGEKVYVRSVILDAFNRRPTENRPQAVIGITGPKGEKVANALASTADSVSGFAWDIPAGQPGGEYKVTVTYPSLGTPPAERVFDIRAYRAPRLRTQIVFLRDGYGPGDTVVASMEVTRSEGGIPAGAPVTISARVDGVEVHRSGTAVTAEGTCEARFQLPDEIARGEGTLSFVVEDGGAVETAAKTIPILLQTVDLRLYPEGGDLVAGISNRVYFEARTPAGKPADIAGIVEGAGGREVASFRSSHEGRGRFNFVPEKNVLYSLRLTEPSGIVKPFPLPQVQPTGVLLRSLSDISPPGKQVDLRVGGTVEGPLTVTISKREEELGAVEITDVIPDGTTVSFTLPSRTDGILIATVWDSNGLALAERLIYREPAHSLKIEIEPDRDQYVPAGTVSLKVRTLDDKGKPVSAVVGLTVTDDSILEMIDKREQSPRLPVMVFLENEVSELADAHVYLDGENPKATEALDLLLGTQGWRRFAVVGADAFLERYGDAAKRVLALRTPIPPSPPRSSALALQGMMRLKEPRPAMAPPDHAPADLNEIDKFAGEDGDVAGREDKEGEALMKDELAHDAPAIAPPPMGKPRAQKKKMRRIAMEEMAFQQPLVTVREYAHRLSATHRTGERRDFTETVYWNAGLRTDAESGEAQISFVLSDAVTSFRVFADGFDGNGALGEEQTVVESVRPFYVEAKLPLEVTSGDRVLLPLSLVNATEYDLGETDIEVRAGEGIEIGPMKALSLGTRSRDRRIVSLEIGPVAGESGFFLEARAGAFTDLVERPLRVVPRGFPVEVGAGGMLGPESPLRFTLEIPESRVPGSINSELAVFPTPLANLTAALERLIREPSGCFEQTSSTTYPLVMVQQYFLGHTGVDPELISRSGQLLDKGYKRLVSFECDEKGYEWFGQSPGHEALTAYGLMEFNDLSRVYAVDADMVANTRSWLLKARDGKGGFKRERRALHTWLEDKDCSDAYITWSLLESGEPGSSLAAEIGSVIETALVSSNSYVIALGANVALLAEEAGHARKLLERLAEKLHHEGYVDGGTTTIVGSRGISLQIETTSLAILAWLQEPAYAPQVERAIKWLAEVCENGRYGSTQSSVLALKAIIAYDEARSVPKSPGTVELYVDGELYGAPVSFDENSQGSIDLSDISEALTPGTHTVEMSMIGGSEMPCSVAVRYHNDQPASSEECLVGLDVSLRDGELTEGDVTEAMVHVVNRSRESIPTPVAIIGIPGGLEVRHDQLKELVKAGLIASYEVMGREVVLYWRVLAAGQKVQIPLSVVAEIPGEYTGPASRAYEYYADEYKRWVAPLTVAVRPKIQR